MRLKQDRLARTNLAARAKPAGLCRIHAQPAASLAADRPAARIWQLDLLPDLHNLAIAREDLGPAIAVEIGALDGGVVLRPVPAASIVPKRAIRLAQPFVAADVILEDKKL